MRLQMLFFTLSAATVMACSGSTIEAMSGSSSGGGQQSTGSQGGQATQASSATGQGGGGGQGGAGQGGQGGQGGSAECTPECSAGFTCCNGKCANLANDINNCGACGVVCEGPHPFCNNGAICLQAPCLPEVPPTCDPGGFCCMDVCCKPGQLCCEVNKGGPQGGAACHDPVDGTCPGGCPLCN